MCSEEEEEVEGGGGALPSVSLAEEREGGGGERGMVKNYRVTYSLITGPNKLVSYTCRYTHNGTWRRPGPGKGLE